MPDPEETEGSAESAESPEERETAYELLQRGHELLNARHNAQAAVVLERAAREEPGKGSILEALARAYFDSGQHAPYWHETILVWILMFVGLGLSLERLGRFGEARTHLRLAVAMNPASAAYRRALKRVESKAG